jgi:yeast amino acid transporter
VAFSFLTLINGFDVFFFKAKHEPFNVSSFFTAYVGVPIFLALYFGHRVYVWRDAWAIPPGEVDLVTGMARVLEEEKEPSERGKKSKWVEWVKRIWE